MRATRSGPAINVNITGLPQVKAALNEAATRARVARFVAEHWRQSLVDGPEPWSAHPLCMVLAALDGETDPVECGIDMDARPAFLAAVQGDSDAHREATR